MKITEQIQDSVAKAVEELYGQAYDSAKVNISPTRKEFEGDYTVVVFPFSRIARKKPEMIAQELGDYLLINVKDIGSYNVIKGFLNLKVEQEFWGGLLKGWLAKEDFGAAPSNGKKVMVEYSSPNTNKPLHLGHIRNILLGWSTANLYDTAGYDVVRVQIINDRGVHICKSMYAWQEFGNGETPESTGMKSDHFVGKYYVKFEKEFQKEYKAWQQTDDAKTAYDNWATSEKGIKTIKENDLTDPMAYFFKSVFKNTYFNTISKHGQAVKEMLRKWEANDETVRSLWAKMNNWVYEGFDTTYKNLGVSFDKYYYESQTYLLGKDSIAEGLEKDIFYKKEDGSVWADLTDVKLDEKIVLRSDGTSVYMTQDIGTAQARYKDYGVDRMIYVVGDEQEYHFQVLFELLKRLGEPYADELFHLSYGMVDLPTGKMKSREGKVVDADDLMEEVIEAAKKESIERGAIADLNEAEQAQIIKNIGMAALKFFILKVNPKRRMTFNPEESVSLQGQTGPYVQYAAVRTKALARKAEEVNLDGLEAYTDVQPQEEELLLQLQKFPELVINAAHQNDPSAIANYVYALAKSFNKFYHDLPILRSDVPEDAKAFRLGISTMVGRVLEKALDILGIDVPEYM